MNMSLSFADTHRVNPGFQSVVETDKKGFLILFTGRSNPDDNTTQFNYTLISLDQTEEPYAIDVSTDISGNLVEVHTGCLTKDEAMALRKEEIYVADSWVVTTTEH